MRMWLFVLVFLVVGYLWINFEGWTTIGFVLMAVFIWCSYLHIRKWWQWGVVLICLISIGWRTHIVKKQFFELNEGAISGVLIIDSNFIKLNGNSLTGEGVFHTESTYQKVFFTAMLQTEEEKNFFQRTTNTLTLSVEGTVQQLEEARNKGGFDAKRYYYGKGIYRRLKVTHYSVLGDHSGILATLQQFRKQLLQKIEQCPHSLLQTYARLLIFGERKEEDTTVIHHYQSLGIMHMLAISGLHVTMMIHMLEKVLWRCGVTRERSRGIVVGCLLLYGWIIQWNISGSRAIGMFMIQQLCQTIKYPVTNRDSFFIMVLLALYYRPTLVLHVTFQLSYLLTFIVLLVNRWCKHCCQIRWKQQCLSVLLVIAVAFPLICHYFFTWNLLSILLTGMLVFLFEHGLLHILLVYVISVVANFSELMQILMNSVHPLLDYLNQLFSYLEKFRGFSITFGRWQWYEWLIYWGLLYSLAVLIENKIKNLKLYLFLGSSTLIWLIFIPFHWRQEMIVLDIGQGDALLLIHPGWNNATLVDTGGEVHYSDPHSWKLKQKRSQAQQVLIPSIQAEGIAKLNQMMLSHADYDHRGNLGELAQVIPIKKIIVAKGMEQLESMQQLKKQHPDILWQLVLEGSYWKQDGVTWQVLSPAQVSDGKNQDSIVALASIAEHHLLFTGDAPRDIEEKVYQQYPHLQVDILKIAHHGSRNATFEPLLNQAKAKVAVISAGKNNRYGHPHLETLNLLKKHQIPTFKTSEDGAIRITLADHMLRIRTQLTKKEQLFHSK